MVRDPVPALIELVRHAHDEERVQPVHDGGAQGGVAEDAAGVRAPRHGPQLVAAPGVAHVVVPGVAHHLQTSERDQIRDATISILENIRPRWRKFSPPSSSSVGPELRTPPTYPVKCSSRSPGWPALRPSRSTARCTRHDH